MGGSLEELDGTPIRVERAVPASWPRAMVDATALAGARPQLWVFALVAFLARGGIVLLTVPLLVLPSFIGVTNFVGPTSVTPAGPTPRFVALAAAVVLLVLAAILAGSAIAAAAEVALHRATVAAAAPGGRRWSAAAATIRILALRLFLLLPVVLVIAVSLPAYVSAGYRELSLPSDVGVPVAIRVLAGAPVATAAIALAWLVAEVVGGVASRRVAIAGDGASRALVRALADIARSPGTTLLTLALSLAGTVATLVPTLVVASSASDHARIVALGRADPAGVVVAAVVLALAWTTLLSVAAVAAAWRAALWTLQVGRRLAPGA